MSSKQERFRIAVLDDYQHVALSLADWSVLDARATVTVFNDHLADSDAVVERLQPFDLVCVMRERTPMTRSIIERLPKLRMIASTGTRNASIDLKAAEERGVQVVHTGYTSAPTIERRRFPCRSFPSASTANLPSSFYTIRRRTG
jgi:lactate dehydrogenase-like 2-hydroxyacid dehydrogenase